MLQIQDNVGKNAIFKLITKKRKQVGGKPICFLNYRLEHKFAKYEDER